MKIAIATFLTLIALSSVAEAHPRWHHGRRVVYREPAPQVQSYPPQPVIVGPPPVVYQPPRPVIVGPPQIVLNTPPVSVVINAPPAF